MKKNVVILCIAVVCVLAGCNKLPVAGEIAYTEIKKDTTKDDLQKTLGARPNKTETQDNLESYIYEKSNYLSYEGSMTYYLVEDKVLYSRWETKAENEKQGKEIYNKICKDLEKDYSKSNEDEDAISIVSSWTNQNGKQKTVTYLNSENEFTISVMTME